MKAYAFDENKNLVEVYPKTATFSRSEVYSIEESYSKSELDSKFRKINVEIETNVETLEEKLNKHEHDEYELPVNSIVMLSTETLNAGMQYGSWEYLCSTYVESTNGANRITMYVYRRKS